MFHPLRVRAIERLTDDSVAVTFTVPTELRETFRHKPGQHLNVRYTVDGEEIRRSYSICAPATEAPADPALRVGIRLVDGGAFSTYALKELAVGDQVDAMPPMGRFVLTPRAGHYAAIVGGSGITPVLSIASTLLAREPAARFCLIRSDRTAASTMFLDEVADLKDRYPDRFQLVTVLSREEQQAGLPSGRLDRERLTGLLPALLSVGEVDGWYLCGPFGLVLGGGRRAARPRCRPDPYPPGDLPRRRRAGRDHPHPRRGARAQHTDRDAGRPLGQLAGPGRRITAGDGVAQPCRRAVRLQGRGVRDVQSLPGLRRGPDGPQLRAGTGRDGGGLCAGLPVASGHTGGGARLRPLTPADPQSAALSVCPPPLCCSLLVEPVLS